MSDNEHEIDEAIEVSHEDCVLAQMVANIDCMFAPHQLSAATDLSLAAIQDALYRLRGQGLAIATDDESQWALSAMAAEAARRSRKAKAAEADDDEGDDAGRTLGTITATEGGLRPGVVYEIDPASGRFVPSDDPWLREIGAVG
jgi:hypothetical protein